MPCDWGNLSIHCTSKIAACECAVPKASIATSALPVYATDPVATAFIYAGPAMLFLMTLLVYPLYRMLPMWTRSFRLPRSLTADLSTAAVATWVALCGVSTAVLIVLSLLLPADVWGDCAHRGVCVYHMMFCEATRHHSPVRHPANFWSNLPYLYLGIGMLCEGVDARVRNSPRPHQLLDATFALVLLSMCLASFGWHGSNCTAVHFVDIGLMNCVIAFYPYRFVASSLVAKLHGAGARRRRHTLAVAGGFVAIVASQLVWASGQTDQFHEAFPTGHSRFLSLRPVEITIYIGAPGLYPLPALLRMAQRRTWGCVPALALSVLGLPIGFLFHAAERVVVDVYCHPTSLLSQPTACFHVFTAVAIAGAYVQSHAIEE